MGGYAYVQYVRMCTFLCVVQLSCYVYECTYMHTYYVNTCNGFKEAIIFCVLCDLCLTLEGLLMFSKLFQNNVIIIKCLYV